MRKKRLIVTAFILLTLSIISKVLSTIVKIIVARLLSKDAMTLYTLATPTMLFFITLAQLGLPNAVSKIIADKKIHKQQPIAATLLIATINNLLLVVLLLLFIPLLSKILFHNSKMNIVLYAIVPLLPLVTISGILKGYYSGKQRHITSSSAAIIEEVFRLAFIIIIFTHFPPTTPESLAAIAMFSISIGEIGTILSLGLTFPKKPSYLSQLIAKSTTQATKYVLRLALPLSGSRFIGTLTMFLEPIIITVFGASSLLSIQESYGELHGYILPLLSLSSFVSATLSAYLLPSFTALYSNNQIKSAKKLLLQISALSLILSLTFASILYIYPQELCMLLYHKELSFNSIQYIKILAFPFAIGSLQSIFSVCLIAMNKTLHGFIDSTTGSLLRIVSLCVLLPHLQESALFISLLLGFLTTTSMHGIHLYRTFLKHNI